MTRLPGKPGGQIGPLFHNQISAEELTRAKLIHNNRAEWLPGGQTIETDNKPCQAARGMKIMTSNA